MSVPKRHSDGTSSRRRSRPRKDRSPLQIAIEMKSGLPPGTPAPPDAINEYLLDMAKAVAKKHEDAAFAAMGLTQRDMRRKTR